MKFSYHFTKKFETYMDFPNDGTSGRTHPWVIFILPQ
jgi:hypothetical protein